MRNPTHWTRLPRHSLLATNAERFTVKPHSVLSATHFSSQDNFNNVQTTWKNAPYRKTVNDITQCTDGKPATGDERQQRYERDKSE